MSEQMNEVPKMTTDEFFAWVRARGFRPLVCLHDDGRWQVKVDGNMGNLTTQTFVFDTSLDAAILKLVERLS